MTKNNQEKSLTKKTRLRWLRRLLILAAVLAAIIGIWRLFTPEEAVSVFKARQVSKQNLSETINLSGTVAPSKVQEIEYTNIPIQSLLVKPGEQVKKGDRLLLYDLAPLKADLSEMENSRDQAKEALESSQAEAAELAAGLQSGMFPADISSQLQAMTGDLTIGLSELAGGMVSIGNPFQQLVNKFDQFDPAEINQLVELMESLNQRGDQLIDILNDPDLQEDLKLALDDLNKRLADLEELLEGLDGNLPSIPPVPTQPTESDSGDESEDGDPEAQFFNSKFLLKEEMSSGRAGGSMDMEQEDLFSMMEQLQSIPGGSDLLSTYQQGNDLLGMLENQIQEQELLIEKAEKHEHADFDALVAEGQRDLDDIDPNRPIMILYDESKPIVHCRVNRKDALLLEEGQAVNYTTDNLILSGEIIFKSPIATTTPVNSSGQSSDLVSDFLGGSSQSGLMSAESRVDVELSLEGPDLNKIIFGFDISFEVDLQQEEQVLAVPSESLIAERGQNYVYVLNEDNSFESRQIELGIITRDFAEVESGLELEEWIVLNPPASVKEGVRYNVERQGK